jgi:hypothetical protein
MNADPSGHLSDKKLFGYLVVVENFITTANANLHYPDKLALLKAEGRLCIGIHLPRTLSNGVVIRALDVW